MWVVVRWLGVCAAILSLVILVKQAFDFGWAAPLETLLQFYEGAVAFALGWAEPCLKDALQALRVLGFVDLHLLPHWKHIFVLMWLYFGADARIAWGRGRRDSAVCSVFWGLLVALTASVASGTVELENPNMLAVIFPFAGFVLYETGMAVWNASRHSPPGNTWLQTFEFYIIRFALANAVLGGLIVWIALWARENGHASPNLILLIAFVVALAIRNLALGAWFAALLRDRGETWMDRVNGFATTQLGMAIFSVIAGTILFVSFNAGLKIAGF